MPTKQSAGKGGTAASPKRAVKKLAVNKETVAAMGDHQIVEDPAILRQQQRIAQPVLAEAGDVARRQRLQPSRGAVARHQQLAHMADVEQGRRLTRLADAACPEATVTSLCAQRSRA